MMNISTANPSPTSSLTDHDVDKESQALKVFWGVVMSSLAVTASVANILVCIAFLTDRHLSRKASNLLFVSLACSDIIVGLPVMTFAALNDFRGRWDFGATFCLIWVCCDIMACTASILSLLLICVDRYLQISSPMTYVIRMTKKKIVAIIAVTWLISALTAFVPVHTGIQNPSSDQKKTSDNSQCHFNITFTYALVSSSISFYIPCIAIITIYLKLYKLARHQLCLIRIQSGTVRCRTESKGARTSSFTVKTSGFKATLTLGIIVGVFILCWLPFFIVNPIFAKCAACIPDVLFKAFTWLGYVNSCANPFIYTLSNKEFRTAFRNTLLKKIDDSLASRNGF